MAGTDRAKSCRGAGSGAPGETLDFTVSASTPCRRQGRGCHQAASAAQEGVSVTGQLFLVVEELSPDLGGGGEIREGIPECLHGEPAVVADVLERIECRVPGDAARSRHAPVVFRNVNVSDAAPRAPDGGRRLLFLNMGVEGIQVDAAVGV